MAKIPLRVYIHEIEALIEDQQFDQAIAHCRQILKSFPKHIDTYRVLGKTLLQAKRYGEAADILQRVLSSLPDDFIANQGMSAIREDDGNLNEAIWYMERAFEAQPSNSAIQAELRRLYGRRDKIEPPRVHLTRGALARMYIKGGLYPQAVAEIRAALIGDPQRSDLQALLARVYFLSGQRVEAAEVSSALLKKLPFSLVANSILADILASTERAQEAQIYRQRVEALDPYAAHVSLTAPTADQIPDASVLVEKLDWRPGQRQPGQPGDDISEGGHQSGWAPLAGETAAEMSVSGLGLDAGVHAMPAAGELKAADIPDWLQSNAPTHLAEETGEDLDADTSQAEAAGHPSPGGQPEPAAGEAPEDEPGWLPEQNSQAGSTEFLSQAAAAAGAAAIELPDWREEGAEPESGVGAVPAEIDSFPGPAVPQATPSEWLTEEELTGGARAYPMPSGNEERPLNAAAPQAELEPQPVIDEGDTQPVHIKSEPQARMEEAALPVEPLPAEPSAPAEPLTTGMENMDPDQASLFQARNALDRADRAAALHHYNRLILSERLLPEVIQDLQAALDRFPPQLEIWQALGDAYLRAGQLQEAVDAYSQAEDLLL